MTRGVAPAAEVFNPPNILNGPALDNGDFETGGLAPWTTFVQDPAHDSVSVVDASIPAQGQMLKIVMTQLDPAPAGWHMSVKQLSPELNNLQPLTAYELKFVARADRERHVGVDLYQETPYSNLNLRTPVPVGLRLVPYSITFHTPATIPTNPIALAFNVGDELGTVWIDDVQIAPVAKTTFTDTSVTLGTFDEGNVWLAGTVDTVNVHAGNAGLECALGANQGLLARRDVNMDLSSSDWQLSMWVHTVSPATVGRMYVILRSGARDDMAWWTFSGLHTGWNHITIPRDTFYGHFWQGTIDWSSVSTVGVKFETNDNGPGIVTLDDLEVQPLSGTDVVVPAIDRINVTDVTSGSAVVTWRTNEAAALSEIRYGTMTDYGASVAGSTSDGRLFRAELNSLAPSQRWHCQVHVTDSHGNEGYSGDFTFKTEPAAPLVEPSSVTSYPFGLNSVGGVIEVRSGDFSGLMDLDHTAINGVHTWFSTSCDEPSPTAADSILRSYLDLAWSTGKRVPIGFCANKLVPGSLDLAYVQDRVRAFKDHPAVSAWYLMDEPDLAPYDQAVLAQVLSQARDAIHAVDPQHPVTITLADARNQARFRGAMDELASDYYPIPDRAVSDIVPQLKACQQSGLPYYFVFQAFDYEMSHWPGYDPVFGTPGRYPTADEMRAMAYLAIIHGAKGLWSYSYSDINETPGSEWHWTEFTGLAQEIADLAPMLGSSDSIGVRVQSSSPNGLYAAVKAYRGKHYLLVVNSEATSATGIISLCSAPLASIREILQGRSLSISGLEVRDAWTAFGVHVYELTTMGPQPPSVVWSTPSSGTLVSGVTAVAATAIAACNTSIAGVQFKLDGANLQLEDSSSPYGIVWNSTTASDGNHELTALARDGLGMTAVASSTVKVDNTPPSAPAAVRDGPGADLKYTNVTTQLIANWDAAIDSSSGIRNYEVAIGTSAGGQQVRPFTNVGNVVTYTTTGLSLTNGRTYYVSVRAVDKAGNVGSARSTNGIIVDTTAPSVTMTTPRDGSQVSGRTITVGATATDTYGIAYVQFLLDDMNLGSPDSSFPYVLVWNTTTTKNGAHYLKAKAVDVAGNVKTSSAIKVVVRN